jgi:hypothetical protein
MDSNNTDPEDFDETEWNPSDDPTDHPEFFGDRSGTDTAGEIIDKVVDGNASDAKIAIYSALYRKVGDAIDLMRSDVRKDMGMGSQEQTSEE